MSRTRKPMDKLEQLEGCCEKKFVRYAEGAQLYSMGLHTFQDIANDANAVYRIKGICLVNTKIIDEYLENFKG